jgi:hypothetical protein
MKNALRVVISMVVFQLSLPVALSAQEAVPPPTGLRVITSDSATQANVPHPRVVRPQAVALAVIGKCDYSEDGVTFTNFEGGHIFEQGAIIRTGQEARADLFFRRSKTTVRLQGGTEVRLESMAVTAKDGHPSEHALLDLRAGRIFAVVPVAVVGSTLEISHAAGRSVVDGSGGGKYIITAEGTQVSAIGSVIPLKLIGEAGITIIAAGQQFTRQDGKILPLKGASYANDLLQLDELGGSASGLAEVKPSPVP